MCLIGEVQEFAGLGRGTGTTGETEGRVGPWKSFSSYVVHALACRGGYKP